MTRVDELTVEPPLRLEEAGQRALGLLPLGELLVERRTRRWCSAKGCALSASWRTSHPTAFRPPPGALEQHAPSLQGHALVPPAPARVSVKVVQA